MMFLIDGDEEETPDLASAMSNFELCYADSYLDENNWYSGLAIMRRDGSMDLDQESPDNVTGYIGDLVALDQDKRWEAAIDTAYAIIGSNVEMPPPRNRDSVHHFLINDVPRDAAEKIFDRIGVEPEKGAHFFNLDLWRMTRQLRVYEKYVNAVVRNTAPFMSQANAYADVDIMQLDHDVQITDDNAGILFISVHT